MQTITFNDANDIVVGVSLEDVQYKLRLMWNALAKAGLCKFGMQIACLFCRMLNSCRTSLF